MNTNRESKEPHLKLRVEQRVCADHSLFTAEVADYLRIHL